jgi:hypothetical protein
MSNLDPLAAAREALHAEKRRVAAEISAYPGPIAGCDEQFNHLLDMRRRLERALIELGRPEMIPTPRRPLDPGARPARRQQQDAWTAGPDESASLFS